MSFCCIRKATNDERLQFNTQKLFRSTNKAIEVVQIHIFIITSTGFAICKPE